MNRGQNTTRKKLIARGNGKWVDTLLTPRSLLPSDGSCCSPAPTTDHLQPRFTTDSSCLVLIPLSCSLGASHALPSAFVSKSGYFCVLHSLSEPVCVPEPAASPACVLELVVALPGAPEAVSVYPYGLVSGAAPGFAGFDASSALVHDRSPLGPAGDFHDSRKAGW